MNVEKFDDIINSDHMGFFVGGFKDICINFNPWYFREIKGYHWFSRPLVAFKTGAAVEVNRTVRRTRAYILKHLY